MPWLPLYAPNNTRGNEPTQSRGGVLQAMRMIPELTRVVASWKRTWPEDRSIRENMTCFISPLA